MISCTVISVQEFGIIFILLTLYSVKCRKEDKIHTTIEGYQYSNSLCISTTPNYWANFPSLLTFPFNRYYSCVLKSMMLCF